MTKTSTSYERLLEEHLELRNSIDRLRQQLGTVEREANAEATRHWASGIAAQLVKLHEALVTHFHEEEASGALEELAMEFPEHTRRLEALAAEHAELLAEGRRIVSGFMELEEAEGVSTAELTRRTLELLDRLVRHEQDETTLMQRAYTEDLGTPES